MTHRLLGIISGVGSMMVPALDEDLREKIEVVGNYEWRKYYNTGTFEHNFKAPLWPAWGDIPEEAKRDIDIVMSHPECGNFSVLQKDLSKRSEENDIREFVEHIAETRPKFFLMDNLYKSLDVYPAEFYTDLLADYDLFFEPVSNYHYGNIQKNRKRFFMVGALKELHFVFRAGEKHPHGITARDCFGDLPLYEDIPEINHIHVDPEAPAIGWHLPDRSSKDNDGKASYYTYGELAKRFQEADPGKCLMYLSKRTGTEKPRLGYVRFGWDQHGYVLHGGSNSRAHSHFHPETGLPLTVRERARVQGFPDDFYFVLPEKQAEHLGVKQTGKAMPIQFCRFAMRQFIDHLEGRSASDDATGLRFSNVADLVTEQKEKYCRIQGYADQERACNNCWHIDNCSVARQLLLEDYVEL